MENLYNRVENLDEQIRSVKLPYMAWKVLFLIDTDSESKKIASILEANIGEVNSSVELLLENSLIIQSEASATKPLTGQPKKEEIEFEEPATTPLPSVEDTEKEVEEDKTEISDDDEFELALEDDNEPLGEQLEEAEEEEIVIEPIIDDGTTDEEQDIEIKISEEETTESLEDNEFNFNLTGDEPEAVSPSKEEPEAKMEPAKDESSVTNTSAGGKNILVIDDSLVIRKMVEIALEDEDYNIFTAVSGKDGLEALDKVNPHLVILDMMLPDINGIEILKTIKASKGIPVIMLSGKDSPQMIESAKNEGAEEFLPKPFKDDDLVEKIKNLL